MQLRSSLFALFLGCALLSIFWLPLHVAPPASASISYMLGFNNRVALIACGASLLLGCFSLRGGDFEPPKPFEDTGVPVRTLVYVLVATSALCGFVTLIASRTWGMDESPYLLGRMRLLMVGRKPYVDFEYIYGPVLLYAPVLLARASHLNIGPTYFIVWWVEWLLGTAMMALIVGWLGFPAERARQAFLLLWSLFLSFLVNTGATYTPFRELAAPLAMLAVYRGLTSRRRWLAFVGAVGEAAALLCLSPELALAFMAAVAAYLALCGLARGQWRREPWMTWAYAGMLIGFALCLRIASSLHEFDSAREFGSGGSDIPCLLTPTTMFLLAGIFVAGVFGARRVIDHDVLDPRVALVVLGAALLPGTMGRADPSHVLLYSLSFQLVTLVLAAGKSAKTWSHVLALAVMLCSLPLLAGKLVIDLVPFVDAAGVLLFPHAAVEPGSLGARFATFVSHQGGARAEHNLLLEFQPAASDPHVAFPAASPVVMAPFGYFVRGREKQVRSDVELGYFDGIEDLMSPVQVDRKIAELHSHPERDILVPLRFSRDTSCSDQLGWAVNLLRLNFGYSYLQQQRHTPKLLAPLCTFIDSNYVRLQTPPADSSYYELWRRKPDRLLRCVPASAVSGKPTSGAISHSCTE